MLTYKLIIMKINRFLLKMYSFDWKLEDDRLQDIDERIQLLDIFNAVSEEIIKRTHYIDKEKYNKQLNKIAFELFIDKGIDMKTLEILNRNKKEKLNGNT